MEKIVIIGSGLSAFTTYVKLKKFDPVLITSKNIKITNLDFRNRKNISINKYFSQKSLSFGNFKYDLNKNTQLHDRLSFGGNTNIWGGFININSLPQNMIIEFEKLGINFSKLNQEKNGYLSNNKDMRQLVDTNGRILNTSKFLSNHIEGFLDSIEIKKTHINLNYYSNNKIQTIKASKLFLGISFPQLIDLLYRSKMLETIVKLQLKEFKHQFIFNMSSQISENNTSSLILKYDCYRALKHFLGYQNSLIHLPLKLPFYIDQKFLNSKQLLDLDINFNDNKIIQRSTKKFGSSIHYCNLKINKKKITEYLSSYSQNILGVSMPCIIQK
jgi:hypothetical protein